MPRTKKQVPQTLTLRNSAQQIWLAGLGAFALAGEEGLKMFNTLVERGQKVEQLNKERLEKVLSRVEEARGEAGKAIVGRFSAPLDAGMTTALHQLGIPTRKEILTLTKRVEELTHTVGAGKPKAAARKRPAASRTKKSSAA
jgi:poly(hydroxyalkanoate) granule-associated protein